MTKRIVLLFSILAISSLLWSDDIVKIGSLYFSIGESEAAVAADQSGCKTNYAGVDSAGIPEVVTYNGKDYPVTAIGKSAFYFSAIRTVSIPSSVTEIGAKAFSDCHQLESVYNYALKPHPVDAETFANTDIKNCELYVRQPSLAAYSDADVWRDFHSVNPLVLYWQVSVLQPENGRIVLADNDLDCDCVIDLAKVPDGMSLRFVAESDEGYEFGGWTGCDDKGVLTVYQNETVTCSFNKRTVTAVEEVSIEDMFIENMPIENTSLPKKIIRNGHFLIHHNGKVYNMLAQ